MLLSTVGPHTGFFPTIFLAYFAIGLGHRHAFMPLLTIAMADVPAADAGLGSGIINVSQQVAARSASPCSARWPPTTRRRCCAAHHALASSLIGGYHLAFVIGAAVIAVGIMVALALLRRRNPRPSLQPAEGGRHDVHAGLNDLEVERQAA